LIRLYDKTIEDDMLNRLFAVLILLVLGPLMIMVSLLIWVFSGWPVFFCQDRVGYRGKIFRIIKFRTMHRNAETIKERLGPLNEADGPVFKIRNDPRYTGIGRFLSHSGLDELPQIINVIRGEMEFVGPRPLPVEEAYEICDKYRKRRESVRPGIVSPWLFEGYHNLSFEEWMKSDVRYVDNKSKTGDCRLFFMGTLKLLKLIVGEMLIY